LAAAFIITALGFLLSKTKLAEPSGKFESIAFLTESNVRLSAMNKVLDFLRGLTIFILFFLTDWAEFIMNSERTVFNLLN